jgi:DNA-binding IclR family transcriptional regulator
MTSSATTEKVRDAVRRARDRGYGVSRCAIGISAVAVAAPFASGCMSVAAKLAYSHAEPFEEACRRMAVRLSAVTEHVRPMLAGGI